MPLKSLKKLFWKCTISNFSYKVSPFLFSTFYTIPLKPPSLTKKFDSNPEFERVFTWRDRRKSNTMSGYINIIPRFTPPFLAVQLLPDKTTNPYWTFCQQTSRKTKWRCGYFCSHINNLMLRERSQEAVKIKVIWQWI